MANNFIPGCKEDLKERGLEEDDFVFVSGDGYVDHSEYVDLLRKLRNLPGVKKVFIRSGIRFDYLMMDKDKTFFHELVKHHISGQLKVAPEHADNKVLRLMRKSNHQLYEKFADEYAKINKEEGKNQFLVPYYICSHPGAGL